IRIHAYLDLGGDTRHRTQDGSLHAAQCARASADNAALRVRGADHHGMPGCHLAIEDFALDLHVLSCRYESMIDEKRLDRATALDLRQTFGHGGCSARR